MALLTTGMTEFPSSESDGDRQGLSPSTPNIMDKTELMWSDKGRTLTSYLRELSSFITGNDGGQHTTPEAIEEANNAVDKLMMRMSGGVATTLVIPAALETNYRLEWNGKRTRVRLVLADGARDSYADLLNLYGSLTDTGTARLEEYLKSFALIYSQHPEIMAEVGKLAMLAESRHVAHKTAEEMGKVHDEIVFKMGVMCGSLLEMGKVLERRAAHGYIGDVVQSSDPMAQEWHRLHRYHAQTLDEILRLLWQLVGVNDVTHHDVRPFSDANP